MKKNKEEKLPFVSIVIIGRNEAKNLPDCIQSIRDMDYHLEKLEIIYVDSNSTDGSAELARSLGLVVFEELGGKPSAARARNRGLKETTHEIIHFLDGDMRIAPMYLKKAVQKLDRKRIVAVFGRIKERGVHKNWISQTLAVDWARKQPGFVNSPGGGGTFLKSALEEVGAYNADLVVDEEIDLGMRLREKGYKILYINEFMGEHDYGVKNFLSLLNRFFHLGENFGRLLFLPHSFRADVIKKPGLKLLIQGLVGLLIVLILLVLGHWLWLMIFVCAGYILLILYIFFRYRIQVVKQKLGFPGYVYYYLAYAMKPLMFVGLLWSLIQKMVMKKSCR